MSDHAAGEAVLRARRLRGRACRRVDPQGASLPTMKEGAATAAPSRRSGVLALRRVVHFELDRMRGMFEADNLAHFQVDVAVDEVVIKHTAGLEEGAILVELLQRLAQ